MDLLFAHIVQGNIILHVNQQQFWHIIVTNVSLGRNISFKYVRINCSIGQASINKLSYERYL